MRLPADPDPKVQASIEMALRRHDRRRSIRALIFLAIVLAIPTFFWLLSRWEHNEDRRVREEARLRTTPTP
jgi:hypothetical protein